VPGLPVNDGRGGGITYKIQIDSTSLPPGLKAVIDPDFALDATTQTRLSPLQPTVGGVNFGYIGSGMISGAVFADNDRDNRIDPNELGIANVTVRLIGIDVTGANVSRLVQTDAEGEYFFDDLLPGVYRLVESQPTGFGDWFDSAGNGGGRASNDMISDIVLTPGMQARNYSFAEIDPLHVSKRDFLSIPYYTNPREQYDVNADGFVSPIDALLIVNTLNGTAPAWMTNVSDPLLGPYFLDVNADAELSPMDVLLVVNRLNQLSNLFGGEGEPFDAGLDNSAIAVASIADSVFDDPTLDDLAANRPLENLPPSAMDSASRDGDLPLVFPSLRQPSPVALSSSVDAAEPCPRVSRPDGDVSDSVFGDDESLDDLLACVPAGKPTV
jgi:hypothetical protein